MTGRSERKGRHGQVALTETRQPVWVGGLAARASEARRRVVPAKAALVGADAVAVAAAMLAAFVLWLSQEEAPDLLGALREHLLLGAASLPLWIGLFARRRLYNARFCVRRVEELRRVANGCVMAVLAMSAVGYVLQLQVSRAWLLLSGIVACCFVGLEREVARLLFRRRRQAGLMLRNVVIVGSNEEATELATMLIDDPTLGYRVAGFVTDDGGESIAEVLGTLNETLDVLRRTGATGVIIAAGASSSAVTNRLVRELLREGIHVELSSALRDVDADRLTVRPLGRVPVAYLEPRRTGGWRHAAKRAFDITLTTVALLLVAPVALLIAVAIKLDSRGPVIFKQVRVGRDGRTFKVWKFRTMVVDAEARLAELRAKNEAAGPLFKLRNDPRITRVGGILRRTSLDELPQLVNVLRGEMSLVGPRPALPNELSGWNPELHARLWVKPGITGMWQVHGRSDASFDAYSRLDLYYVDNWSLVADLAILLKTIPAVLFGRGAY